MTLTLEIAPELESSLRETAAREGIAPDRYVLNLLEERLQHRAPDDRDDDRSPQPTPSPLPLWQRLTALANEVPDEEFVGRPDDIAEEHDHYLYGTPKRT